MYWVWHGAVKCHCHSLLPGHSPHPPPSTRKESSLWKFKICKFYWIFKDFDRKNVMKPNLSVYYWEKMRLTGHHWVDWATKQSEEEEESWLQTGSARYPEFTVKIFCRSALICVPPILLLHRALICSRENKPCVLLWRVRCQLSGIEVWVVKSVWTLLICVLTMADNFMNIEQKVTHWDSF